MTETGISITQADANPLAEPALQTPPPQQIEAPAPSQPTTEGLRKNIDEQVRAAALGAAGQAAGEDYRNYQERKGKLAAEDPTRANYEKTRNWLGFIETQQEGTIIDSHHIPLRGDQMGVKGDMYVVVENGRVVRATTADADPGNNGARARLEKVIAKKGNTLTVLYSKQNGSGWDAPVLIEMTMQDMQDAFVVTHTNAFLDDPNIGEAGRKAIEAHANAAKGRAPLSPDLLAVAEAAERETPGLKGKSIKSFARHVQEAAERVGNANPALQAKLEKLQQLQERMSDDGNASVEDMTELLGIITSTEFTGPDSPAVQELETQYNTLAVELTRIESLLANTGAESERAQLLAEKAKIQKQMKDVILQKSMYKQLSSADYQQGVEGFLIQAVNGALDKETLGRINTALEKGDMNAIAAEALKKVDETNLSDEKKEQMKARIEQLKKTGLMVGGGLLLALLLMMFQSMDKK